MEIIKIISSQRERIAVCRQDEGKTEVNVFPPEYSDADIAADMTSIKAKRTSLKHKVDSKTLKG